MVSFKSIHKSYYLLSITLLFLFSLFLPFLQLRAANAAPINLVSNPSAETVDPTNSTLPLDWSQGNWGTNTSNFSFANTGHTGSHSLSIQMSAATSGDAKWYFKPVAVSAGTQYTFSDYYQSGVSTSVIAQTDDGNGVYSYIDLGNAAPTTAWAPFTATLKTPANAKNLTVFHLIKTDGSLTIDDVSVAAVDVPPIDPTPVPPTSGNLITNPSLETASIANPNLPLSWSQGGWGTNTAAFSYPTTGGQAGSRYAKLDVTSYLSGDAKWYFTPVAVSAGSKYNFSNYYKSTVMSSVVAQFDNGAGTYSYVSLGNSVAMTTWTQFSAIITVPAGMKNVTVFHALSSNGTLETDNFSITSYVAPPTPAGGNMIPNPSVETSDPANSNLAQGWQHGSWGTNTASFTYATSGHTGLRSLKTTISSYTNGSAYWYFGDQAIVPGQMYDFSDYYKSTIPSEIDAAIKMNDGSIQYMYLGDPSASPNSWSKFQQQFTAPAGAVSVAMYHNINAVGTLSTDDFSLTPFNYTSFNRAIVSLTFDDGWKSIYTNGLPLLQKYQVPSTQFIVTGYVDTNPNYITTAMLKDFAAKGHEIGSHTVSHPDLTTLTAINADSQLKNSQTYLQNILAVTIKNFASPYGAMNDQVLTNLKKYYTSHRGVQAGYNAKNNFDAYNIRVQNVVSSTTPAEVQSWINKAIATKTWLVLVYHQVDSNAAAGEYNTSPAVLDAELAGIQASGIKVETIKQALAELIPQL